MQYEDRTDCRRTVGGVCSDDNRGRDRGLRVAPHAGREGLADRGGIRGVARPRDRAVLARARDPRRTRLRLGVRAVRSLRLRLAQPAARVERPLGQGRHALDRPVGREGEVLPQEREDAEGRRQD